MELNLLPLVTYAVSRGSILFTMHKAIRFLDHPLKIGYSIPIARRNAPVGGKHTVKGRILVFGSGIHSWLQGKLSQARKSLSK